MKPPDVQDDEPSQEFRIPRWCVPIYWSVGLLLVHNLIPWGVSLLSNRKGWVNGRPGGWNLLSLTLIVAGIICVIWTMAMHYVRTPQSVSWVQTPGYLLLSGPYKFSRNPMFLAELTLWLGWALFYGSVPVLSGFLLLWASMNFIVVPREERVMEARFGEDYLHYHSAVPRWLGRVTR